MEMTTWTVVFVVLGVAMVTEQEEFPLDMAPDSVDDKYDGCRDEMFPLAEEFEKEEWNPDYSSFWNGINKWYYGNFNPAERTPHGLKKQQLMAITAYSKPDIYKQFNQAVRTQRSTYQTGFQHHALHFFLTTAIQALKTDDKCLKTFRRTGVSFNQKVLDEEFRFGSFASSSLRTDLLVFGNKSCFQIHTCFGANISAHSAKEDEMEVLIPPYEVFRVMKIERKSENALLPCEVVYDVASTGKARSDLNCGLTKAKKLKKTKSLKCMGSSCFGK